MNDYLYDEENIELTLDNDEEMDQTEEIEETESNEIEANRKFMDLILHELKKLEPDRKKFKFVYHGVKYEAIPLALNKDKKKCIFDIKKPTEQTGVKYMVISEME